ncbi:hypothetical protein GCM10022237_03460 [Nocardioides ginsengisoli]|uniref:Secreted protein n=1 Tax=Nocardioides ginsengisoli TaxID=363868 RepID=A0ABW3VXZ5_9ACTN
MKKLMMKVACTAALAASTVLTPVVTGAMSADAATLCTHNWVAVGLWQQTSTPQVAATNTCGNMWSVETEYWDDDVRGQYKQNGVWTNSQAGWKKTTTDPAAKEIVLDLKDGEPLRAWLRWGPRQGVLLWY